MSEEEASSWRSQTLRIIDPPESKKPESDADIYRLARKEKAYEVYADRFLSTCDVFLNDLDSDAALKLRTELMSLNRMLGDLCAKLYAQNVRIRVLASRKDFAEFGGTTFSVDSKLMLAHGSLNIHDNDDHSKDGWPLDLIVQPAIIAYHNKRAESDNEYSVWLQGVVWTAGKRGPLIGEAKNSISAEPATGQKHSSNANTESSRRQCIWIDLSSTKDRRESECTSPRCPDGMPQFLAAKVKTTSDEAPGITSSPSEMANHCQPRPGTPKSARPDATTSSMHPAKVDAASGSKRHQSPEEQESVAGSKKKKVTAGGHDPSHANP